MSTQLNSFNEHEHSKNVQTLFSVKQSKAKPTKRKRGRPRKIDQINSNDYNIGIRRKKQRLNTLNIDDKKKRKPNKSHRTQYPHKSDQQIRDLLKEERKEKNRQSAQLSRQRRKQQNDFLNANIPPIVDLRDQLIKINSGQISENGVSSSIKRMLQQYRSITKDPMSNDQLLDIVLHEIFNAADDDNNNNNSDDDFDIMCLESFKNGDFVDIIDDVVKPNDNMQRKRNKKKSKQKKQTKKTIIKKEKQCKQEDNTHCDDQDDDINMFNLPPSVIDAISVEDVDDNDLVLGNPFTEKSVSESNGYIYAKSELFTKSTNKSITTGSISPIPSNISTDNYSTTSTNGSTTNGDNNRIINDNYTNNIYNYNTANINMYNGYQYPSYSSYPPSISYTTSPATPAIQSYSTYATTYPPNYSGYAAYPTYPSYVSYPGYYDKELFEDYKEYCEYKEWKRNSNKNNNNNINSNSNKYDNKSFMPSISNIKQTTIDLTSTETNNNSTTNTTTTHTTTTNNSKSDNSIKKSTKSENSSTKTEIFDDIPSDFNEEFEYKPINDMDDEFNEPLLFNKFNDNYGSDNELLSFNNISCI